MTALDLAEERLADLDPQDNQYQQVVQVCDYLKSEMERRGLRVERVTPPGHRTAKRVQNISCVTHESL